MRVPATRENQEQLLGCIGEGGKAERRRYGRGSMGKVVEWSVEGVVEVCGEVVFGGMKK